jgi:hypothetical protein
MPVRRERWRVEIERGDADAPRHAPDRPGRAEREDATAAGGGEVLADPERRVAEHQRYRALVDRDRGAAGEHGAERDQWAEAEPELRGAWEKIKEKYGYEERDEPTPPADGGAWQGKGGRRLDAAQNEEIDLGYARIREVGEKTIIPGVLSVEAEDTTRRLAGFDKCFKGADRLKEKVADLLEPSPELSATEALGAVSDAVRFTYAFPATRYAQGVPDDVERLKACGFELDKLKNTWPSDQYKGINTQWVEPRSGVRFEVQFHTQASLEAKELSHKAYERIRSIADPSPETDREAAELEGFQSSVNATVPIPPGVNAIEDYRREKRDG